MISTVKNTSTAQYPSFKGVVKVGQVFVNGVQDNSVATIKIATQRLKDLLMKQDGIITENSVSQYFRQLFKFFDNDYKIPQNKVTFDTRNFFYKLRIGNMFYFISGEDAAEIAKKGITVGKKSALESISARARNMGVEDSARKDYRVAVQNILKKFNSSDKPTVQIYTFKDSRGTLRLSGVNMGNTKYQIQDITFLSPYKKAGDKLPKNKKIPPKPPTTNESSISKVSEMSGKQPHPILILPVKNTVNPNLYELSQKSWPKPKPVQLELGL